MAIVAKKVQESKTQAIQEIKDTFINSKDFIFTNYRGLTVEQITALRKQLRTKNVSYKVVKNNFARIAFEQLSAPAGVAEYLVGPTAVAIAPTDSNEVARILLNFAQEVPALEVKGALIGDSVYGAQETAAFSRLPGKLELVSMLMSVLNGPARNLVGALNDIPARVARVVKAVEEKKAG